MFFRETVSEFHSADWSAGAEPSVLELVPAVLCHFVIVMAARANSESVAPVKYVFYGGAHSRRAPFVLRGTRSLCAHPNSKIVPTSPVGKG